MKIYVEASTDAGIIDKLKSCFEYDDDTIAKYTIEGDYFNHYCIIDKDSDDISMALEDTLHRLIDHGMENDIFEIMGAYVPTEKILDEFEEEGNIDYYEIDLGYIIDGFIESFEKI